VFTGAAAAALATAWPHAKARAQGFLANLAPEEPIEKTLQRLFGSRPIKDGSQVITFELPLIAEDGGNVAMSVDVKSPMTPQS
jgi:predicted secreted protein